MGLLNKTIVNKSIIASENFDNYIGGAEKIAVQVVASDVTEAKDVDADTEVDITEDTLTSVAHGYVNDTKGQLTSTGTLPAGLAAVTDYYVVGKTDDTFQLAATLGGEAIDITDVGTAESTHTFTPTALSGSSVVVQKSCDGSNWIDVASATSITEGATFMVEDADVAYTWVRVKFAISAGFMNLKAVVTGWTKA